MVTADGSGAATAPDCRTWRVWRLYSCTFGQCFNVCTRNAVLDAVNEITFGPKTAFRDVEVRRRLLERVGGTCMLALVSG